MDRSDEALNWDYDEGADILYLSFGEPQPAYGDHLDDDIVLQYSLENDEIVGLTVLGFQEMGGVDALIERLEKLVSGLHIPLITAHADELRERAAV
ncbi:MAG: DUF2283 domain-containing protein [Armatimonadota bacterium]|nr:DUF2283 domain-containing protein [Armatimonadota bacterium]